MANNITNISLANTFGDWVSTTVQVVNEINSIGKNDWTKDSGTLYIQSNGTSLDVANSAYFRGPVSITGVGSSLTVGKNTDIKGVLQLSNQDLDANPNKLILSANGVVNVNYLNVTGAGLSANIANNMGIGGTLAITGNTTTSANLVVTKDITSNNQTIGYDLNVGEDVTVGRNLSVAGLFDVNGTATLDGQVYSAQNLMVAGKTYTSSLQSNTNVTTVTLNSSGKSFVNDIASNTSVVAPTINASTQANVQYLASNTNIVASGSIFTNSLSSNTVVTSQVLNVSGTSFVNALQANTVANTRTLSVTGTTSTDKLAANTIINTPLIEASSRVITNNLQSNTAVNTTTISVTGTAFVNTLQANTSSNVGYANANTISVSYTANVNSLTANADIRTPTAVITYVNAGQISTSGKTTVSSLVSNTTVDATTVTATTLNGTTLGLSGTATTNYVNSAQISTSGKTTVSSLVSNTSVESATSNVRYANANTVSISYTANVNSLTANADIRTPTAVITYINGGEISTSGKTTVSSLVSNTSVESATSNVRYSNANTISISYTANVRSLTANADIRTPTAVITYVNGGEISTSGKTTVASLVSNTSVGASSATITYVNAGEISTSGKTTVSSLVSNTSVESATSNVRYANATTLSVSHVANVQSLTSNTNIVANNGTVWAGVVSAPNLYFNNNILGVGGTGGSSSVTAGSGVFGTVTVIGNFTIQGTTVYNSDTLTLNAAQSSNVSAYLTSYRPNGANATIRWNESSKWWDLRDVEDPLVYNKILTSTDYNGINAAAILTTSTINNNISANVVSLNNNISANVTTINTSITNNAVSANAVITKANTDLKNYVDVADTTLRVYTNTQISANAVSANAVITKANTDLKNYTDSTFVKLSPGSSQTITGDVSVTGNFTVNGTTTTINTQNIAAQDSLIKLASGQTTSDVLDIGFYGSYQTGGLVRYTGLFRKAADKYYLSQGITSDPTANNITDYGTLYRATLDANFTGGTVSGLSAPIVVADGGTGRATFTSGSILVGNGTGGINLLSNTGTAGTYGSASVVPVLTTDTYGRVSGVTATTISIAPTQINSVTGTGSATLSISPTLTGAPIAPTASLGTSNTMIATTAFVENANVANKLYTDAQITANAVSSNAVITKANTDLRLYTDAQITANAVSANAVITKANTDLRLYTDAQITANAVSANAVITKANTDLKNYVDVTVSTANTDLKNYVDVTVSTANTDLKLYTDTQITANAVSSNAVIVKANTDLKSYVDANKVSSVSGTSGRITSSGGLTPTIDLATSGVSSGTYGGSLTIPTIIVDTYGRVTTIANNSLSVPITAGGTGASSAGQALTNLLPTGTTSGYVLTTGGPGTFYWAASGGGSGSTPGTTINSTRLSYTANGTGQGYETPTYTPGASQLRVYFDGVRQFESEYVETSSSVVTFNSAVPSGVSILIEVDGYIDNPYYANNITFTAPFGGIVSDANTIQLALQDIETRKATLSSPEFTGSPIGPTAPDGTSNTMFATTAFVQTANTYMKTYVDGRFAANVATSNTTFGSLGVGTSSTGVLGEIRATNNITAYYSDERLKTNLGNIENALNKVNSLNGFYHEANDLAQSLGYQKVREVGVSAQEVQSVLPEVVAPAPIDDKYLTVRYERLVPLLIEAIKELNNKVDMLQNELNKKV